MMIRAETVFSCDWGEFAVVLDPDKFLFVTFLYTSIKCKYLYTLQ